MMGIIAPLGGAQQLLAICRLRGTPHEGGECPTCKAEREQVERVVEESLREDPEEKDIMTLGAEEWLEERGGLS